jgi:RNA polymerase sigma factor (sigma-70 family)
MRRVRAADYTRRDMAGAPTGADPLSAALEAALTRFAGAIRAVARRYRLSDADLDDLLQEVRLRLWRAHQGPAASEQIDAAPASYVHRTAVTAVLDLFRRRRARREGEMAPLEEADRGAAPVDGPEGDVAGRELAEHVERAIETIPASRRPVVRMYLAGYAKEEIARLMEWSDAKTRNLLYRGLADLREQLTAMGIPGAAP